MTENSVVLWSPGSCPTRPRKRTSGRELHRLLAQAGFRVTGQFSDYDFTEFQEGSSLLIVEAEAVCSTGALDVRRANRLS